MVMADQNLSKRQTVTVSRERHHGSTDEATEIFQISRTFAIGPGKSTKAHAAAEVQQ